MLSPTPGDFINQDDTVRVGKGDFSAIALARLAGATVTRN
jgi:hypothetical protein